MKLSRFCKIIEIDENRSIVINTLYRSVTELDTQLGRFLFQIYPNRNELNFLSEEELVVLKESRIIVDDKENEFLTFINWLNKIKYTFDLIKVILMITSGCNLDCIYCFEKGFLGDHKKHMNISTANRIVSWLAMLANQKQSKAIDVYFYGGEPTIKIKTIEKIINKFSMVKIDEKFTIRYNIFSNGTILTSKLIDLYNENLFNLIQVSLDGPQNIHDNRRPFKNSKGSFEIIMQNVKTLLNKTNSKIRIVINFDLTNYKFVSILLNEFKGFETTNLEFAYNPVFITRYNKSICEKYSFSDCESGKIWAKLYIETIQRGFSCLPLRIFETGPCTFWRASHLIFDVFGDIYKCIGTPGIKNFKIGNINADSYEMLFNSIEKLISINPWDNQRCLNCVYLPLCLGGCRFHAIEQKGNINVPFCHKDLIDNCDMELIKYAVLQNEKYF